MKITTLTLEQVICLQWLTTEGYDITLTEEGAMLWRDRVRTFNAEERNSLDITELFLSNTEDPTRLSDKIEDLADEQYCPGCKSYVDPIGPDQLCYDCCQEEDEANTDPYTLRGLNRSDFI